MATNLSRLIPLEMVRDGDGSLDTNEYLAEQRKDFAVELACKATRALVILDEIQNNPEQPTQHRVAAARAILTAATSAKAQVEISVDKAAIVLPPSRDE